MNNRNPYELLNEDASLPNNSRNPPANPYQNVYNPADPNRGYEYRAEAARESTNTLP